ncbi:phage late control D family protein [Streptomyces sp. NPDC057302]|uniref:phage late control D family protein n=1 Tax=Streptomyces sp. NPDC057302 TaxID=3346094 RepID=UPI0036359FFE
MRLEQLDRRHDGFYVPAFAIRVGGKNVLQDLFLAVSAVSVDLKEKAAGHFTFTVTNAFDWEARQFLATRGRQRVDLLELFRFGSTVEISMGYGDRGGLRPMLTGLLTEITTDFGAGGTPELTVSGYDGLYPLTVGKASRHWEDKPDSTAVQDLASAAGIRADVRTTTPVMACIDQNNESEMAFILKLAERNGVTFYERDRTLYFGPRRNDLADVVELEWGRGLLGFSPEVSLTRQVSEVRVHGRSVTTGAAIVGKARRGQESGRDTRARSGGERIVTALGKDTVLNSRAAVRTQSEADARAKAILEERAQSFLTGSGESVGLPELLPDTNVAISGLGPAFSKTYYLGEATHRIDGGGYHTTFTVQETTV